MLVGRCSSELSSHKIQAKSKKSQAPSAAEGSAVPRTFPGNAESRPSTNLSSRPERTRISCSAALDMATYAAFVKESRIKLANATKFHRKSGVAEWRDLRFLLPATNAEVQLDPFRTLTQTAKRHEKPKSFFALTPRIFARSVSGTKSNIKSNNSTAW